ncbi:hypothetical protein SUGI_0858130 [Cryptomeria japonica]|nr:hypothetical protein SUGI_0858130 [Cryptomeria japonica]
MKVLTWNVRGLNAPNKKRILKHCILASKPELTLIQETTLNQFEIGVFKKKLGHIEWEVIPAVGASGGLGII